MTANMEPSAVTDPDCAAMGQELTRDGAATLVRTEVRALAAGASCLVQTVTPPRHDATTILWLVVTARTDYLVRCVVDPARADDLAACEAFGHGLHL